MSFLNTTPLVEGLRHGPQAGQVELEFAVPSECAERLRAGRADVGLVPVIEMHRQGLQPVDGIGIACRGAVRSILLVSRVPFRQIRRLAADINSRTSVELVRVILARRYGVRPVLVPMKPELDTMLAQTDAALIIGDAALAIDPAACPYATLDLGAEWMEMTGLPFVFALWAGPAEAITPALGATLHASYAYGLAHLEEVIDEQSAKLGLPRPLVAGYLRDNIVFPIGAEERAGLALYLDSVRALDAAAQTAPTAPQEQRP